MSRTATAAQLGRHWRPRGRLAGFPKLTDWKKRIEARPALKKARSIALPDGLIGAVAPLPGR